MSKKARLQKYALLCFLYHQDINFVNSIIRRTQRFHSLLISRRYLEEFFNERSGVCISVREREVSLICYVKDCQIKYMPISERVITALLRLTEFESICLDLCVGSLTPELVKGWLNICRTLEKSESLKSIEVNSYMPRESYNRFMFECIPDKITKMWTTQDIFAIMGKRRAKMESISCFSKQKKLNYYRIFQINAKCIEIVYDHEEEFCELGNCGPFLPNPSLQELKVMFELANFVDDNDEGKPTAWDFHEKLAPAYRNALTCLYQVNPQIHLNLYGWTNYGNNTIDEAIQKMYELIRNAKFFVDIAQEIGIHSLLINIRQGMNITDREGLSLKQFNERLVEEFQVKFDDGEFVLHIDYKGIQIKLVQVNRWFYFVDADVDAE